jgi:anti-sigma regulatory factor (Ser/Thr protein kinase)
MTVVALGRRTPTGAMSRGNGGSVDALSPAWESGATERSVSHLFDSDTAEVVRARRLVRAHLEDWGLSDDLDGLTLAVSELVTNAVVHGRGRVELTMTANDATIRVEVADQGGGRPKLAQPASEIGERGLGLRLVDELVDEWGTAREGLRTSVWLERRADTRRGDEPDREPS